MNEVYCSASQISLDVCTVFSSVWVSEPVLYLALSPPRRIAEHSQTVLQTVGDSRLLAGGDRKQSDANLYVLLSFRTDEGQNV